MNQNKLTRLFVASTAALAMLFSAGAAAESDWRRPWGVNLPEGVTSLSQVAYSMHMLTFWIVTVIGVAVFAGVFFSVWKYRKSQGAKPATWHHSTTVEIVWTAVPFLILLGIAVPATQAMIKMEDTSGYEMTVKVTGYQWMWEYEYLDEGIHFYSRLDRDSDRARQRNPEIRPRDVEHYLLNVDNPLVVPVNTKIRFLLTANDVIHSWWVPELGWKKDTIPGFVNEAWAEIQEPGTYRGQCAELCGRDHAFMPIVVVAKTEEDYEAWVAEQQEEVNGDVAVDDDDLSDMEMDDLMALGEDVYDNQCMACHQAGGEGMGDMFPALAGSDKVLGDRDEYKSILLDGVSGTTMQSFASLSNQELAGVLTYVRNAWGNDDDGGDVFQPADVEDAR
ncbi:cytochrome c oxidase subunit II [Methylonatrum kenyense]|uniref:cytochrome c oxidase subunit II n=1 Tax=Methylonatrum kenyense TaxID=455253 RepID=UPI0020BEDE65|nr:cytochrome c oxidase subunit II [Methylonatrum kenyense]MCK8516914.1 cytochrome c oxidase subunit II [Methylonatrum kenyense]